MYIYIFFAIGGGKMELCLNLDGKAINFEVVGGRDDDQGLLEASQHRVWLDTYRVIQEDISPEELNKKIPELTAVGISADEIAEGIPAANKTWKNFQDLVKSGMDIHTIVRWWRTDHVEPMPELGIKWLMEELLATGKYLPNELALHLASVIQEEVIPPTKAQDQVRCEIVALVKLGVKADVLIANVLRRDQVKDNLHLLLQSKCNINKALEVLGYFPEFYREHSVDDLVEAGAKPLQISRFALPNYIPESESETIFIALCKNHLVLSDFVARVVVADGRALHIVAMFATYFRERYIDLRAVFQDSPDGDKDLLMLAYYSELAELGVFENPKRFLRVCKKEYSSKTVEEYLDCKSYSLGAASEE